MTTLEELLAEDGFNRGRHKKKKTWPRRGQLESIDLLNSPNSRFGFSDPIITPVKTNLDVKIRRSVSLMVERSNFDGGRYEEQSPDAHESKVKNYLERKGSFGRNQLEVNIKSRRFIERKDDSPEEIKVNGGYDRCYRNYLFEHEEPKLCESPNSQPRSKDGCPVPAQDVVVLKAITSMINICVDRLIKDGSFRSSIYQVCVTSLNSSEVASQAKDNDVLSSLKEAIDTVETMINEGSNQLLLKKASLKLSAITGLKLMESDDEYTYGIPNSHLTCCAHLYLSILYKIQKKNKVSAKHLMQVFCDSPYQARTKLLPDLWKPLFSPPLTHLKAWYDKEAKSIQETSEMMIKQEFLDKVYNDLLDLGTSQFAAYYKGWLMDDNSAPSLPSIFVPFASFPETAEDANDVISVESFNSNSYITMSSKSLYDYFFCQENIMETTDLMKCGEEEVKKETEDGQSDVCGIKYDDSGLKDGETWSNSPNSCRYAAESFQELYSAGSQYSVVPFDKKDQKMGKSSGSISSIIFEADEIRVKNKIVQPCESTIGYVEVGQCDHQENDDDPKLKKLTQTAFQLQVAKDCSNENSYNPKKSIDFLVHDSYFDVLEGVRQRNSVIFEADSTLNAGLSSMQTSPCSVFFRYHEDSDQGSLFATVPKDFLCPLTGLLLKEPVTLESGYTFELAAIKKRFDQGSKTCPVTGQSLQCSTIPETNIALKHMINEWVVECFRVSPFCNAKSELALSIFEQMMIGFSSKDKKENIKHLISLGGLHFLTQMFELGSLEEKSCAAELLVQCIQSDGCYRNYLAMNIRKPSLLELINSGQVHTRTNAASLIIELICLNRRMDITSFLKELKTDASGTIMNDLLLCLKSSLPEERVLVAVLLLHLDLIDESQVYSIFRKEAVKCIITTLESCLSNYKFIRNCRTALLMLGGIFSVSGEILTETWLLKQAGFDSNSSSYYGEDNETKSEEEERKREEWLKSMASIFIGYKKKSFLESLSNCWKLGSPDLARICLVTTAWLSHALPSLLVPASQISFMPLLPRLKESLKSDLEIKQRVLACLCLLNFSKISECMTSLKAFAAEIHDPLKSLSEITWTAKHLYNEIFEETS